MLGRAASCCDLLRLSPTPGDSSEDDEASSVLRSLLCAPLYVSIQFNLLKRVTKLTDGRASALECSNVHYLNECKK